MRHVVKIAALSLITFASGAATAYAQNMPDFIAGKNFKGIIILNDGVNESQPEYQISDIVDPEKPSKVINQAAGCTANMFAVEVAETKVVFKERLIEGKDRCLDLGYTTIEYNEGYGQPIASYSPLRKGFPMLGRGVLYHDNDRLPDEQTQRAFSQRLAQSAKHPPNLWGTWKAVKFSGFRGGHSCHRPMNRTDRPWLPFYAKAALTFWPFADDTGGQFFVATPGDFFSTEETVDFAQLDHWQKETFYTANGLSNLEGQVWFIPERGKKGEPDQLTLVYQPKGEDRKFEHRYTRCPNNFEVAKTQ